MSTNYDDYLNKDQTFIDSNNELVISEIKDIFKDQDEITICAKGPSVKYSDNPNSIGINQGLIFSQRRFLVCNDFESFFGIEDLLKDVEYIFIPSDIHTRLNDVDSGPNDSFNYKNCIQYLRNFDIKCKFFIYTLHNTGYKYKFPLWCTTYIAQLFFRDYINIKKTNITGHGDKPITSYHKDLELLDFNQGESKSNEFISTLRKHYIDTITKKRYYV